MHLELHCSLLHQTKQPLDLVVACMMGWERRGAWER